MFGRDFSSELPEGAGDQRRSALRARCRYSRGVPLPGLLLLLALAVFPGHGAADRPRRAAHRVRSWHRREAGKLAAGDSHSWHWASSHLPLNSSVASLVQLVERGREEALQTTRSQMIGAGKDMFKVLAICGIFAIGFKMISSFCRTKQADCRRFKPIGRFLMWAGWDDFETFEVLVTVHSVGDIQKDGMLGSKEFKVVINFSWSKWETMPTKDCRWEQTKALMVPQGASEGTVALYSLGKIKDSRVGGFTIDTMDDMLNGRNFWGEKKKFKIEQKGKLVGTLSMTFRKRGEGDDDISQLPIDGIDDDSALAIELMKEWEELCNTPGYVKPEAGKKLEGDAALFLLSKVLCGELRVVDSKMKEQGKAFVMVLQCNYADLQGDDREEALKKQMEKARKKGLQDVERKWYWVWYEDKKAAEKWTHPDGFVPIAGITSVSRTPGRSDEFLIKNSGADPLRYRRESGKGLDVWVSALEIVFTQTRKAVKEKKDHAEKEEHAMQRMTAMHQQWVATRGTPKEKEEWKQWFEHFRANNYEEELITKFYHQISQQQKAASGGGKSLGRKARK